jgi:hypothetical protein
VVPICICGANRGDMGFSQLVKCPLGRAEAAVEKVGARLHPNPSPRLLPALTPGPSLAVLSSLTPNPSPSFGRGEPRALFSPGWEKGRG